MEAEIFFYRTLLYSVRLVLLRRYVTRRLSREGGGHREHELGTESKTSLSCKWKFQVRGRQLQLWPGGLPRSGREMFK